MKLSALMMLEIFVPNLMVIGASIFCTYYCSKNLGWIGLLLSQFLVAALVLCSDLIWISHEMSRSDWDGSPDQDAIFYVGVILRVIASNTVLLPIGWIGIRSYQKKSSPKTV